MTVGIGVVVAASMMVLAGCGGGSSGSSDMSVDSSEGSPIAPPADTSLTDSDVRFALAFLPNHDQAVEIADLAVANTDNPEVLALAEQIRLSREPEVDLMRTWVAEQDAATVDAAAAGAPGMLTAEQMDELRNAKGVDFDRLFAESMIIKHEGAIETVIIVQGSSSVTVRGLSQVISQTLSEEIDQLQTITAG